MTWAPVEGVAGVYYKRTTVMVRFPSPTGGISRLVRTSSLFSLGYVPNGSPAATTTTVPSTTTATTIPTTTTVPAGCAATTGDTQGPAGTIALAGGAGYTNQTSLTIINTVADLPNGPAASGVATMQYSNVGPTGPWLPDPAAAYGPVYADWPVAGGDGTRQVWARFVDCAGNPSAAVITDTIVIDQIRPQAPTVSGTERKGRIDLTWSAVTDPGTSASGVASYRVYRLDKGASTPIAVVTGTSYGDGQLTGGQAYTYWVTAVDQAGNEGQKSNHWTGTPS